MSEKQYIPSSEKETWSSQVGHFSAAVFGSSPQNKSITENSESENKDKSIGEEQSEEGDRQLMILKKEEQR